MTFPIGTRVKDFTGLTGTIIGPETEDMKRFVLESPTPTVFVRFDSPNHRFGPFIGYSGHIDLCVCSFTTDEYFTKLEDDLLSMACELCEKNEETPGHEPWCQQCSEINSWVRSNPAVARKVLRRISQEK